MHPDIVVDCIQPCRYQVSNSYSMYFKDTKIYVWENDDSTGRYYNFIIRFSTTNTSSIFLQNLDLDNKYDVVDYYGRTISDYFFTKDHHMCLDLFNTYLGKTK